MALTWGTFTPHGAIDDFAGMDPASAWARARDFAVAADELGYDHIWTSDHLLSNGAGGDRGGMYFEAFTLLAALSQVTHRARLGQLVTCSLYRNAGLLAKEGANIDIFSAGRLILGLGGGWDEPEFRAYGYDFPSPRGRYQAFAETLEAVKRLWTEDKVDLDGEYVKLTGAVCSPKPVSEVPIWTGTHGPRGLAKAAEFADVANFNQPLAEFVRLSGVLQKACEKAGRNIETSVYRLADLSGGEAATKLLETMGAPPEAIESLKDQHFVGGVDEVVPKVQAFVDAGARHIVILPLDAVASTETIERFLGEVVTEVRIGG